MAPRTENMLRTINAMPVPEDDKMLERYKLVSAFAKIEEMRLRGMDRNYLDMQIKAAEKSVALTAALAKVGADIDSARLQTTADLAATLQRSLSEAQKAYVDLEKTQAPVLDAIVRNAEGEMTSKGLNAVVIGTYNNMAAQGTLDDKNFGVPQLNDSLLQVWSGLHLIAGSDPDGTNRSELYNAVRQKLVALGDPNALRDYDAMYNEAARARSAAMASRAVVDGNFQTVQSLVADIDSGKLTDIDAARARAAEAMEAVRKSLTNASTGIVGVTPEDLTQRLKRLHTDDEFLTKLDNYQRQILAQPDSGDRRDKIAAIVAAPKFQWWAKENNLQVGQAHKDPETGKWVYVPGPQDMEAIYYAHQQMLRRENQVMPLYNPKRLIKVSEAVMGTPLAMQGRATLPSGEPVFVIQNTAGGTVLIKQDRTTVTGPQADELASKLQIEWAGAVVSGDRYLSAEQASEVALRDPGSVTAQTAAEDGTYPEKQVGTRTYYGAQGAPRTSDPINSIRVKDSTGWHVIEKPLSYTPLEDRRQGPQSVGEALVDATGTHAEKKARDLAAATEEQRGPDGDVRPGAEPIEPGESPGERRRREREQTAAEREAAATTRKASRELEKKGYGQALPEMSGIAPAALQDAGGPAPTRAGLTPTDAARGQPPTTSFDAITMPQGPAGVQGGINAVRRKTIFDLMHPGPLPAPVVEAQPEDVRGAGITSGQSAEAPPATAPAASRDEPLAIFSTLRRQQSRQRPPPVPEP